MTKYVLDLFCGAGGASAGYAAAGFEVYGVDIKPQPHYPYTFIQADVMEFPLWQLQQFDLIHASPPCQAYSPMKALHPERDYPDLVAPVREMLQASTRPYVIENVVGAPLIEPFQLCGSMFKLGAEDAELRRHRLFETNPKLEVALECSHNWQPHTIGVYGSTGGESRRERQRRTNRPAKFYNADARREAMGINWMNNRELTQSIPPVYTEYIGLQMQKEGAI